MKKFRIYLIVFVSTIFLCFCVESEVYVDYVIINDSSYDINLKRYYDYEAYNIMDSTIERNSFLSIPIFKRGNSFSSIRSPYAVFIDSVRVTFSDSLSVIHGSKLYDVLRSVRVEENYVLEESTEGYRKYTYTFTNADVEEAAQINLSQ
ncbi:hypothetical protein N8962_03220 [Flavobacteriales bacterium]|nr:hypothetical protein [Flavobacteriales bacterium]